MDFVSYNFTELISPNISLFSYLLWLVFSVLSQIKVKSAGTFVLFLILEERLSAFHRWVWCWLYCLYCLEVHSLYTHFTHFVNPLAAFKFFSLSLVLRNVIIMCHGIVFFISFALGIYWTCICWYTVLSNLEKISQYFFKYFLSISPFISKNPITCIFCHLKLSHSSLILFLFALKCFSVFYFG